MSTAATPPAIPAPAWAETGATACSADPARRTLTFVISIAVLAALPVLRAAAFSESIDLVVTTALVFAGAGWHLWRDIEPRCVSPQTVMLAYSTLAVTAWQVSWIGIENSWCWRVALVVWALCAVALWGGIQRGWRVVVAFVGWALWLGESHFPIASTIGDWVARRTATAAGWTLWQSGFDIVVQGNVAQIGPARVEVGEPCTGLPLACLLVGLVALAALLLRFRWRDLLLALPLIAVGAFLIGVVRVAVLLLVVENRAVFEYWHGAAGGSWFSAIGIALLAWFVCSVVNRSGESATAQSIAKSVPAGWKFAGWPIAVGAAASLIVSVLVSAPTDHERPSPAIAEFSRQTEWSVQRPIAAGETDHAATLHYAIYRGSGGDARAEVVLAHVPALFTGDARVLAENELGTRGSADWELHRNPDGTEVWLSRGAHEVAMLAVIASDGSAIARHREWVRWYRSAFGSVARWGAWLTHRRPLPDKSADWLLVRIQPSSLNRGGDPMTECAAVFAAWQRYAADERSTH